MRCPSCNRPCRRVDPVLLRCEWCSRPPISETEARERLAIWEASHHPSAPEHAAHYRQVIADMANEADAAVEEFLMMEENRGS